MSRLHDAPQAVETAVGRVVTVVRHPRAGRELAALGAELFRGKDVLDIGSGDGRLSLDLARVARRVTGVEPSAAAVAASARRAAALGLRNVRFEVGAAQHLDLGHRRFDVAVFTWSL